MSRASGDAALSSYCPVLQCMHIILNLEQTLRHGMQSYNMDVEVEYEEPVYNDFKPSSSSKQAKSR